jgi:probable rRNA maturation factor
VAVEIVRRGAGKRFPSQKFLHVANEILRILKLNESELSLALIGNREMQRLNGRFRHKDYPTDVLSFPAEDQLAGEVRLLGDVVISVEKAREQAKDRGRSLDEEMVTLMIHGILHLIGYDHERSPRDAQIMGRAERKIHRQLCDRGFLQV